MRKHKLILKEMNMVPVLSITNAPLMPCSEKRARRLMEKGEAELRYQKGIFCIRLLKEPSDTKRQDIACGVDPGSKREGYTVLTRKAVILNITTNTPHWVKSHLETRRMLRRARRQRKTPYRKMRANRSCLRNGGAPPSTKARWDAKLRILAILFRILPITHLNVEDIRATTKKGKPKWNLSFSPLEVGKKYFEEKLLETYPNISLALTKGFDTSAHRKERGFPKSKDKLSYAWEAHNSDSHSLAEMAIGKDVKPYGGLYRVDFLEFYRRQLHVQNPARGGIRKPYGTTVSARMSRGSVVKDFKTGFLCFLGGESKGRVSVHDIENGKRISSKRKVEGIKVMYNSKWRTQLLPSHQKMEGVSAAENKYVK